MGGGGNKTFKHVTFEKKIQNIKSWSICMFWSFSEKVHHGLQLPSTTTFLNSNANDVCYHQSSNSNVHVETWHHDQWKKNAPYCKGSVLPCLRFNDVQQMMWGELWYIMQTRSHFTNISLQTHVPQSLCKGNKHVFKLSNLLDHQMPMDGDDAILGFKMMDEEKTRIIFITFIIWKMNYV